MPGTRRDYLVLVGSFLLPLSHHYLCAEELDTHITDISGLRESSGNLSVRPSILGCTKCQVSAVRRRMDGGRTKKQEMLNTKANTRWRWPMANNKDRVFERQQQERP